MDARDGNPMCYSAPECTEVYYKRSLDNGTTWEPDVRLTNNITYSARPIVASSGNNIFIAYDHAQANDGNDATIKVSNDGGNSWGSAQRLTFNKGADHTTVTAHNSFVIVSWYDMTDPTNFEVYLKISTDLGVSFGPEERVSNAPGDSAAPYVGATTNYVHVLWGDRRTGTLQVFYRRRALQ